jgi:hypothetical protein
VSAFGWSDTFAAWKARILRGVSKSRSGTGLAVSTVDFTDSKRRRIAMRTNTIALLLTLALTASTLNCGGAEDGFAVGEPSSGGSLGDSSDSAKSEPDSDYIGSWAGTWKTNSLATDQGSISVSISASGAMTGSMKFSGSEEQESLGPGTLIGQVKGSAVVFSYKFANLAQVSATGTFGGVFDGQTRITFSVDGSSGRTGYFDLSSDWHIIARILDGTGRE